MNKFRFSLTTQIFIGLALGVIVSALIHRLDADPVHKAEAIEWAPVLSRVFLNLIKVIIAPLIFSTLVVGIEGAGSIREVGRIGLKVIIYFEIVTTLALFIGLGAVNITKPGIGVNLFAEQSAEAIEIAARASARRRRITSSTSSRPEGDCHARANRSFRLRSDLLSDLLRHFSLYNRFHRQPDCAQNN